MNIIDDLKILLNDLKNQFNNNTPEILNEKIIYDKEEYVLKTDIYSQNYLQEIANKYHPNSEIISEELNNYHDIDKYKGSIVVMDPLDGTHNYLYGLPMWGISYTVFSESRKAIESYIGLPMIDVLIAFSDDVITLHSSGTKSSVKKITINTTNTILSKQMISFDNQFYKDPFRIKKNFNLLVDNTFTIRISGSAVFDIAMIVIGKLNARVWHHTEIYDVAPAFAFLKHAGSLINMNTGGKASLSDKSIIATTDIALYEQLEEIGFMSKVIDYD